MTAIVKAVSPFADAGPGFNHAAAQTAYDTIAKCATDEEAALAASMLLGAMIRHDLVVHGEEIAKAYREVVEKRLVTIGKRLVTTAVEQTRSGGDPSAALRGIEMLDLIAKDISGHEAFNRFAAGGADADFGGMSASQRSMLAAMNAKKQKRDLLTGRFVQESTRIHHLPGEAPLHQKQAELIGIQHPDEFGSLTRRQKAQYQRAYREVSDLLEQYSELDPQQGVVHLEYETTRAGRDKHELHDFPAKGKLDKDVIDPHRKVVAAHLSVLPSTDLSGPGVQARFGDALGEKGIFHVDTWDADKAGTLANELTRSTDNEQYAPGARRMRRMGALSSTLNESLGPLAPPKLKLALAVGERAGELGPEAQKVIGPTADRAAYRYRGTERKTLDPHLANAFNSIVRDPRYRGPEKREMVIHGITDRDDPRNWTPSAVTSYFRTLLPRADLNTLQRKSGRIPPSQGAIIDRKGKIALQAVGFADDHYLPFNLKNLGALKGGEYIRTRTFGGPTTEDIYTGLIGRARALTVVSHNGSYTVEFDDDLKGGRRFNDKAAQMVTRYGQLLDAVQSEQVRTGGLHPSKVAELRTRAGKLYNPDSNPEGYETEFQRLKRGELRNPTLTPQQRSEAAVAWLEEEAASHQTRDGHVMTAPELTEELIQARAIQERMHLDPEHHMRMESFVNMARTELHDDDPAKAAAKVALRLNKGKELNAYLERAQDDYVKSLTPLQLDSQGYQLALEALQEQFPYYIKRTEFHPWVDAKTSRDTGYVAPKHNRPAEVLAGYFNEKVNGHGKVRADSTRFQNYGVRQGKLDHYGPPKGDAGTTGKPGSPSGGGSGGAGTTPNGGLDAAAQLTLKRDAAMRLFDNLRSRDTFSLAAVSPNGSTAIAGTPVADFLSEMAHPKSPLKNLHYVLTTDRDVFDQLMQTNHTQAMKRLDDALRENEHGGGTFIDIDPGVKRQYTLGGTYQPPKELGSSSEALASLDDNDSTEYAFGNTAFSEDNKTQTPDDVHAVYQNDPKIEGLLKEGMLPENFVNEKEFTDSAKDVKAELRRHRAELYTWRQRYAAGQAVGTEPYSEVELANQVEGLKRANQLHRRYKEAVARDLRVTPPRSGAGGATVIIQGVDPDKGDLGDQLKQLLGQ